jgi:putative flippase GtrA
MRRMFKILQLLQRQTTFLRYIVVGVLGTGIDLGSLYFLTRLSGIDPRKSWLFPCFVTIAFLLAVVNNYILNRLWTFGSRGSKVSTEFIRFFLVSLGGLALTQGLMWVMVSLLGVWYLLAKALTSLMVLIWNFGLNKFWTFRQPASSSQNPASMKSKIATVG